MSANTHPKAAETSPVEFVMVRVVGAGLFVLAALMLLNAPSGVVIGTFYALIALALAAFFRVEAVTQRNQARTRA